jgi:hypothetical protein
MSIDLAAFLRARLDEDGRDAAAASPGPWSVNAELDEVVAVDGITVAEGFALSGRQLRATTTHIARHDPARVLREVDAMRALLDARDEADKRASCADFDGGVVTGLDDALRLLALPYSDHPEYQETWRP